MNDLDVYLISDFDDVRLGTVGRVSKGEYDSRPLVIFFSDLVSKLLHDQPEDSLTLTLEIR